MKNATLILEELNSRLQSINENEQDDSAAITRSIDITAAAIVEVKSYVLSEPFQTEDDEIEFFKKIKPEFDGRMIFYLMLSKLIHKTAATNEKLKPFYQKELEKLQPFYDSCYSFLMYYRMNHIYMDKQYFLRKSQEASAIYTENHIFYDRTTNALMSGKLARIVAYDMFRDYITEKLFLLSESPGTSDSNITTSPLTWTARKSFLIELMYALQAFGVFNNTSVDIRKIAIYFSKVFNIHFGNIYKTWEDIRIRKKNPTPFLDALKMSLVKKIDLDNENAM